MRTSRWLLVAMIALGVLAVVALVIALSVLAPPQLEPVPIPSASTL